MLGLSTKTYEAMAKLAPSSVKRGKDEQQLALSYRGGPLAQSAARSTATLGVGDRAPDAALLTPDGAPVRLFEIYRGPQFTALACGTHAVTALASVPWPGAGASVRRIAIDVDVPDGRADQVLRDVSGGFAKSYGITGDTLLLIRPDGYIAAIASRDIAAATESAVRALAPDFRM